MSTINLTRVDAIMDECDRLVADLAGKPLDEALHLGGNKAETREIRIQRSRDLQQLAHLLELAATLVRNEYWVARGGADMIYGREAR